MAALLVLAALGLLSRLRLGAEGAYTPEGWTLRVRVDRLHLDVTAGGEDPGDTALFYGRLNAFLSMTVPLLEHHFEVKDRRIRTAVDFQAETTRISFRVHIFQKL